MIVVLSEAKNLIISTESIVEILRLTPQNDITTHSPKAKGGELQLLVNPFGNGIKVIALEFLDELPRPIRVKDEEVDRRLPVRVNNIREDLAIAADFRNLSSVGSVKLLHNLLHPVRLSYHDGIRNEAFQIWHAPTIRVDGLAENGSRNDRKT
jgi:hypothetical protein